MTIIYAAFGSLVILFGFFVGGAAGLQLATDEQAGRRNFFIAFVVSLIGVGLMTMAVLS